MRAVLPRSQSFRNLSVCSIYEATGGDHLAHPRREWKPEFKQVRYPYCASRSTNGESSEAEGTDSNHFHPIFGSSRHYFGIILRTPLAHSATRSTCSPKRRRKHPWCGRRTTWKIILSEKRFPKSPLAFPVTAVRKGLNRRKFRGVEDAAEGWILRCLRGRDYRARWCVGARGLAGRLLRQN